MRWLSRLLRWLIVPITITATAGSASANSFVTEAEMTAYCDARLNASVWTGAAAQLPALVEATRDVSLRGFEGDRASATQALSWPRSGAVDPDSPSGNNFASTVVPDRVKNATCELALQYLKAGTTDLAALDATQNVLHERIDVIETTYTNPGQRKTGLGRFPRVMDYLRPLLCETALSMPWVKG